METRESLNRKEEEKLTTGEKYFPHQMLCSLSSDMSTLCDMIFGALRCCNCLLRQFSEMVLGRMNLDEA